MKVSEKGAVSIYGMGRFLVTSAAVTDGAWAAAVGAAPGHPWGVGQPERVTARRVE
jgi:hypothetical protein